MTPQALAAQYGLTTADTLPARTPHHSPLTTHDSRAVRPPEYVDATPRRPRRSDVEARAEADIGAHWVSLLSIERPMPRAFGDNHGVLPIWVESNADWRQSGVKFDQQQPVANFQAQTPPGEAPSSYIQEIDSTIFNPTASHRDPVRQ